MKDIYNQEEVYMEKGETAIDVMLACLALVLGFIVLGLWWISSIPAP